MSEIWIKGNTLQGRYPERKFSAVLKAIYPKDVQTQKGDKATLRLDFETGEQVTIWGLDKVGADGFVPSFMDLGKFLNSLNDLKIEYEWGISESRILGFRTVPDIIGKCVTIEPLPVKPGDEQYGLKWGVVTSITENKKGATVTTQAPKKETGYTPEIEDLWIITLEKMLIDPAKAPQGALNEAGIQTNLRIMVPDANQRKIMSDHRKEALSALCKKGILVLSNGAYSLT